MPACEWRLGLPCCSPAQPRNGGLNRVRIGVTFDRARIVSLRKEGMGATEIAKAVGCKRGNVYKALKAVGLN